MTVIAYLAPEIPSLSATFVYQELLGLEALGHQVAPFSVRRPAVPAEGQDALAKRVVCLYEGSTIKAFLVGIASLPKFGFSAIAALKWLLADVSDSSVSVSESVKLIFQFLVAARLASRLKDAGCQHLHVHFAHVPAQIGMYASAMANLPFTVMAHANDIFERGLLLKQKAQRAKKFLTISEFNRAYLADLGLPVEKLAVMRCGVSFKMFDRENYCTKKSAYRIGTLGRLVEKKGVDVLIRAVALLRDRSYEIHLSITGEGPMRAELEATVSDLELTDFVSFEGSLSHDKVAEWMRGLDVFVLACRQDINGDMDGIPVVLMEAMSQSVPVVSTRLSGIPELVIHRRTGLLAEPNDAASLAEQMDAMLTDEQLHGILERNAQQFVHEEFGYDVNLHRLLSHIG